MKPEDLVQGFFGNEPQETPPPPVVFNQNNYGQPEEESENREKEKKTKRRRKPVDDSFKKQYKPRIKELYDTNNMEFFERILSHPKSLPQVVRFCLFANFGMFLPTLIFVLAIGEFLEPQILTLATVLVFGTMALIWFVFVTYNLLNLNRSMLNYLKLICGLYIIAIILCSIILLVVDVYNGGGV